MSEGNAYGVIYQEGGPGLVQVIQVPMAAPHRCAVCGFAGGLQSNGEKDRRVFIDFNFTIDYYGQVVFCSDCIVVIANAIGYLSAQQAEQLREHIAFQTDQLISLKDENVHLRNAIASLTNSSHDAMVRESLASIPNDEPGPVDPDEDPKPDEFTIDEPQPKIDEPVTEQGSNDLPGPTTSFGPSGLLDL
jgi:hypothetical protein